MDQYEVMKEDAILGPFNIDEIAEFVHSGLILKRDYAYNIEYPDSFRTVEFFLKKHGKKVSIEHNGNIFFSNQGNWSRTDTSIIHFFQRTMEER